VLVGAGNLRRAYSLDAGSQELVFVGGPLIVAVVASPEAALVAAGLLCLAGTATLSATPASRAWRPIRHHAGWRGAPRCRLRGRRRSAAHGRRESHSGIPPVRFHGSRCVNQRHHPRSVISP
jgi:hypothetical protein